MYRYTIVAERVADQNEKLQLVCWDYITEKITGPLVLVLGDFLINHGFTCGVPVHYCSRAIVADQNQKRKHHEKIWRIKKLERIPLKTKEMRCK